MPGTGKAEPLRHGMGKAEPLCGGRRPIVGALRGLRALAERGAAFDPCAILWPAVRSLALGGRDLQKSRLTRLFALPEHGAARMRLGA